MVFLKKQTVGGQADEVKRARDGKGASSVLVPKSILSSATSSRQAKVSFGGGNGFGREPELPLPKFGMAGRRIENQEVERAASSSVGFRHEVENRLEILDRPHGDMAIFDPTEWSPYVTGLPMNGSVSNNLRIL